MAAAEAHGTALACGDALVSFSLTLVLLTTGFIVLYPLFFVFLWRPHRIRYAHRQRVEVHQHFSDMAGIPYDPESNDDLSHAWHSILHLDHRSGRHIKLFDQEGRTYFNDGLPDLPNLNIPSQLELDE